MSRSKQPKYEVDIVTPLYGGADYLSDLAESLFAHEAGASFQWILVDDATPDDREGPAVRRLMKELEEQHENVVAVFNKVNGGYSHANNLGASKGRAPFILLLNSDTRVLHDGWLGAMLDPFITNPVIGISGAKLLFFHDSMEPNRPAGMVQHAGVVFNIHGNPYHIFVGWSPDHPKVNEARLMRAVTGACLMTRRKIWKHLKGLDPIYGAGNFEDIEYCVRCTSMGYAALYNPAVVLEHYGGGSNNTESAIRNNQIFHLRNEPLLTWDEWRFF